jgi:hypothetical protein
MNRKSEEKNIRKLAKSGKISLAVTHPARLYRGTGLARKAKGGG